MGELNVGQLLGGNGYTADISIKSQSTSSTAFKETFNQAKVSVEKKTYSENRDNEYLKCKSNKEIKKSEAVHTKDKVKIKNKSVDNRENKKSCNQEDVEDSQILTLVSQSLQLPIQDIQQILEKLNLEVGDLLFQEGFSEFIQELYGQGNMAELLMNTQDVKSITALFEQLSELVINVQIEDQQSIILQEDTMNSSFEEGANIEEVSYQINSISDEEVNQTEVDEQMMVLDIKVKEDIIGNSDMSNQDLDLSDNQQTPNMEWQTVNPPTTVLVQSFETNGQVVTQTTTKSLVSGEIIMEQIDFKVLGETREINLQLSPRELGDLNIKIVENNSVLVAEIKVDNDKAKELILSEMHQLKENLESQGLTIADVKVDIRQNNHNSHMEQERQKSSKRIQEIISKHLNEIEKEEEVTSIQMTSEVDYMV